MITALEIKDLNFAYESQKPILRNIELNLNRGELLCILGSNGCGKSTLLQTIIGLNKHFQGSIKINGKEITEYDATELAQNISIVFQDEGTPFPFTVLDIVTMGRAPYVAQFGAPQRADREKAENALQSVGVAHLKDKIYTNLSGGERQMVLIARALAQEAGIMLMDEPTSHLDFRNQALVMKAAYSLAKEQNMAIVMTTHAPQQAFLYSAKCALMYQGRFLACGSSHEVLTESNLSVIYNMKIRLRKFIDEEEGKEYFVCNPVTELL